MDNSNTTENGSASSAAHAVSSETWRYLAPRTDSWRKQLFIKGRNITVGQLVGIVVANKETPEQASENLALPLEAIHEAFLYFEQNKELIQQEAGAERQYLRDHGCRLEPPYVPR